MHIISNETFESDNLGKRGVAFWYIVDEKGEMVIKKSRTAEIYLGRVHWWHGEEAIW